MTAISRKTPAENVIALVKCNKCGKCCSLDSCYIFEDELKRIADFLGITEEKLKKKCLVESEKFNTKAFKVKTVSFSKPFGPCMFFNKRKKECSIHSVKPTHCRIGNPCMNHGEAVSIWFTLNYFVNEKDPESIRQWNLYLKSHPTIQGGELKDLIPDAKKLQKILSYEILTIQDLEKYDEYYSKISKSKIQSKIQKK
ncbi:MAG: YkgJ family cysteine cluster protein [Nanoarchaeota archaeon]|nr:YkgJ family cysteine cluster protein [Nanoarchaeota archaeon]